MPAVFASATEAPQPSTSIVAAILAKTLKTPAPVAIRLSLLKSILREDTRF
jgi:hypothetical protein